MAATTTPNTLDMYDEAARHYLNNHRYLGTSPTTIGNYATRIKVFRQYLASRPDPNAPITEQTAEAFRNGMIDAGRARSTVRQYLLELSIFFDAEIATFLHNPFNAKQRPKADKRPYDILIPDDKAALLWRNVCPIPQLETTWARNYAIVVLLLSSEIRNKELLDLRPCDLDFDEQEIYIEHGKGDKFRCIDFPFIAQTAIKMYLASGIRPATATDTDPLFGTEAASEYGTRRTGETWHRGTMGWLSGVVERTVAAITGVSGIRSHDLRHVGARLDLNGGMRLEALQSKLGHSNPNTTQIYADRVMARGGRASARAVLEERDRQAALNAASLNMDAPDQIAAIA